MSKHMPPVPPEQQTPYGGPEHGHDQPQDKEHPEKDPHAQEVAQQGRQGNIRQNTSHQGYQQDR